MKGRIPWRMKERVGSHVMKQDGKTTWIEPGDEVRATKEELGNAIDKFEPLEPIPVEPQPEPKAKPILAARGDGKFDVLHPATGKPINDVPVTEIVAPAMGAVEGKKPKKMIQGPGGKMIERPEGAATRNFVSGPPSTGS